MASDETLRVFAVVALSGFMLIGSYLFYREDESTVSLILLFVSIFLAIVAASSTGRSK